MTEVFYFDRPARLGGLAPRGQDFSHFPRGIASTDQALFFCYFSFWLWKKKSRETLWTRSAYLVAALKIFQNLIKNHSRNTLNTKIFLTANYTKRLFGRCAQNLSKSDWKSFKKHFEHKNLFNGELHEALIWSLRSKTFKIWLKIFQETLWTQKSF